MKSGVATVCSLSSDGNTASCSTPTRTLFCTYNTTTEKWSCHPEKTGSATPNDRTGSETFNKLTGSQIPLGLKSALDSAIKSPNGGLVAGQNNTQVTNSSEMRINNSPPRTNTTGPTALKDGTTIS